MNILISSPSLDANTNVSGISSVVSSIYETNTGDYDINLIHFKIGRSDKDKYGIFSYANNLICIFRFIGIAVFKTIDIFHQNLPLNRKGIIRESVFNILARLFQIPIVIHMHGGEYLMSKPRSGIEYILLKRMLNKSTQRIVLSDVELNALKNIYDEDATILPNCVNIYSYKFKKRSYLDVPSIIFIGRLHESKGLNEIITSFPEIYKKKRFKFVVCGKGPLEDEIIGKMTYHLKEDFSFKGVVTGAYKIEIISESDFFILPSNYGEGLPIALLEAMSCGLIPIVTDDASMKTVVQHMHNGIKVEKRSADDIMQKTIDLLNLANSTKLDISRNARLTIEENYSLSSYMLRLAGIYRGCLQKQRK